ncbi:MAG: 3-hydroxyacyl-CoA dehydrogenase NAD-binding domain-containing protein [Bacteroidota bacterium]|nr:3-hydroxyacyl-CoA dehydrogenase NAD-binding domain-containing protein [Bacteroidota bacterium]
MKNIIIIGAGTMGNGIAHTFAQHEYNVTLVDTNNNTLEKALNTIEKNLDRMVLKEKITQEKKISVLNNIKINNNIKDSIEDVDLVIEAATEDANIKLNIFKELDSLCPAKTILASNTSSISITTIASVTKRADKVIGMHFMNPVPIMKLIEVIKGDKTSDFVTKKIMEISRSLNKIPVEVNDSPGFVANRILMPMINESIYTLHEKVSGVEEIDTVMILGMSHPMGPLYLADFIGLDVCLSILEVMHKGFEDKKYFPCPLLTKMVREGKLGIKSGEGFYDYTEGVKNKKIAKQFINDNT